MTNNKLAAVDMANIFQTYTDEDGYEYYNLLNSIYIDGDIDASLYDEYYMTSSDNWYDLANRYYGDNRLWWTILIANNIINPFESLANTKIKILKSFVVSDIISQINLPD